MCVSSSKHQWHLFLPYHLHLQLLLLWPHHTAANLWTGSCSLSNSLAAAHRAKERTDSAFCQKTKGWVFEARGFTQVQWTNFGLAKNSANTGKSCGKLKSFEYVQANLAKFTNGFSSVCVFGVCQAARRSNQARITWRAVPEWDGQQGR